MDGFMGKRRKRWHQPPQTNETIMIEHSIRKHTPVPTTTVSNIIALPSQPARHTYGHNVWVKLRCENYINLLRSRGFKEGEKIKTNWDIEGTIEGFKEVPEDGWAFSGGDLPNCITIRRNHGVQANIFYNEDELTLIGDK